MAKIQEYQQRVETPMPGIRGFAHMDTPDMGGRITANLANEVSGAVTEGAQLVLKKRDDDAKAWAADNLSQQRLNWTQEFIDRQSKADPGAPDFTPTLLADYDKSAADLTAKAPTASAQRYMAERLSAFRTELGDKALSFEANARIDNRKDQFVSAIDNTRKLMNSDPGQYDVALSERLAEIDAAQIPPIQKSALRQKAIDGISEAAVWSQIQKSPSAFLENIGFLSTTDPTTGKLRKTSGDLEGKTGNRAFDMLPFDKRTQMFQQAVLLKAQIDGDADRQAAKMKQALSDDAAKTLWGMNSDGKLDRNAIENYRQVLSVPEYHSLLTALDKGDAGQKTDPGALRAILQTQMTDPNAAVDLAFKAHRNGLLSNADLQSEVTRARTLDRQEGPKSEYERARQYLVTSMDPGPLVHDPLGRSRMAEAVAAFDSWYLTGTGGKQPDGDVMKRAQELSGQYKLVDMRETILGLPMPRSGTISRNTGDPARIKNDVMKAAQEAQRRLDAGQYNPAEYSQEMATLNRWRKAVDGVRR